VLETIAKPRHVEASVRCKVLGNRRTIFFKLAREFLAKLMSQILINLDNN
jgi:hypothetical protein